MISMSVAASIEYYTSQESGELLAAGNYYAGKKDAAKDPLYRPLRVYGAAAEALGLREGDVISAQQFARLYCGYSPDGKTPLHEGITPQDEQEQASKAVRIAEIKWSSARSELQAERRAARESGIERAAVDLVPAVVEAAERMAAAKTELDKLRSQKSYRRPATDFVFSAPADFSLLHSRLLADGDKKGAADMEAFFMHAAREEMAQLARLAVSGAGKDEHGVRSTPVDLVYTTALHFDSRPTPGEDGAENEAEHNVHAHFVVNNLGRRPDGSFGAVNLDACDRDRRAADSRFQAKLAAFMKVRHGAVIVPKAQKGGIGWQSGASMALADKGLEYGKRAKQVEANKKKGMSAADAKRTGRLAKSEIGGADHIKNQKSFLDSVGLSKKAILGSKKEMDDAATRRVETSFKLKYENGLKVRSEWENSRGFPKGRPVPFKGKAARDWFKNVVEFEKAERKAGRGAAIPRTSLAPPGKPGHKAKVWAEAVDRATAMGVMKNKPPSADPDEILKGLLAKDTSFSMASLKQEVGQVMQFQVFNNLKKNASFDDICGAVDERYEETIGAVLKRTDLVELDGRGGKVDRAFTSSALRERENELYGEVIPDLFKERGGETMDEKEIDARIDAWEKKQGFGFSPQQRGSIKSVVMSTRGAQIVEAWAGSGKSALAGCLVSMLKEKPYKILAMAPSNNASDLLRVEIAADISYTPQRLLLEIEKGITQLDAGSFVYLDEASMVDFDSASRLLHEIRSAGARVLFSGDPNQLESVGSGKVFNRIIAHAESAGDGALLRLNSSLSDYGSLQRQKMTYGKQLTALMSTQDWKSALRVMAAKGMIDASSADERIAARKMCSDYMRDVGKYAGDTPALMKAWEKAWPWEKAAARERLDASIEKSAAFYRENLMLGETNQAVNLMGSLARADLKKAGMLGTEDVEFQGLEGRQLKVAVGERLVLREKLTSADALADGGGDVGYTKGVQLSVVGITTGPDGKPRLEVILDEKDVKGGVKRMTLDAGHFSSLAPATSMTVHLSQGQSASSVFYLASKSTRSALALVALTRFKNACKFYLLASEAETVKKAIMAKPERLDAAELAVREWSEERREDAMQKIRAGVAARTTDGLALAAGAKGMDMGMAAEAAEAGGDAASTFKTAAARGLAAHAGVAASLVVRARKGFGSVAEAAKRGIVAGDPADLSRSAESRRTWVALHGGTAYSHDPKTGRIEAWDAAEHPRLARLAEGHALSAALSADMSPEAAGSGQKPRVEGVLVESGVSPYLDQKGEKDTAWALVETEDGDRIKVWGADLGRALKAGNVEPGDGVALDDSGRTKVKVLVPTDSEKAAGGLDAEILVAPTETSPGRVRTAEGVLTVGGAAARELFGRQAGEKVRVAYAEVEKTTWNADRRDPPNKLGIEQRRSAWAAAEAAINDDGLLDELARVGVGARSSSFDEATPREIARRNWVADGDGPDAVVLWDQKVGKFPAWQMAGFVRKGDDGVSRADIPAMVLHDDGDLIFCAVATVGRDGEVEGASDRILAFRKEELGIEGKCRTGENLLVRVASDQPTPHLVESEAGSERSREAKLAAKEPDILEVLNGIVSNTRRTNQNGAERNMAGASAAFPIGGGTQGHVEGGKKKMAGGSDGLASRLGGLLALRERALDGYGTRPHILLQEDQRSDLGGGGEFEAAKRGVDPLRRDAPVGGAQSAGAESGLNGAVKNLPDSGHAQPPANGPEAIRDAVPDSGTAGATARPVPAVGQVPASSATAGTHATLTDDVKEALKNRQTLMARFEAEAIRGQKDADFSKASAYTRNGLVARGIYLGNGTGDVLLIQQTATKGGVDDNTAEMRIVSLDKNQTAKCRPGQNVTLAYKGGTATLLQPPEAVKACYPLNEAADRLAAVPHDKLGEADGFGMTPMLHLAAAGRWDEMFGLAERRPNLLGAKDAHRRGINEVSGGEAAGELLERGIAAINGDVVEKLMLTGAGDMKLLPSGRSVVEAVIETRRTDFAWCFSRDTRITCVEAWCREAAEAEDQKIVEMLMSEGADIDKLLLAVANDGDEAAAKTLIAAGANEGGGLHEAIRSGKTQAVNTLLAAGVSPEAPDENGKTPLQTAMECGRAAAAKTLVEAGAEGGEERLNAAIRSGDVQGAKVLLGASIGGDALRVAVRGRDAKAAKILIAAGCDPNAKDANGQTPLHVAGANLDANTYKILLDGGANHKAVDAEGKTPPEVWAEANNKNARLAGGRGPK